MTLPKQSEAISRNITIKTNVKPAGIAPSDCCGAGKCCLGTCLFGQCVGVCVPNIGQC
jgi:hypothetical protein